jgi:type III restriction enzyme
LENTIPIGLWSLRTRRKSTLQLKTKSTKDLSKIRNEERLKIKCGTAHFDQFEDVEYKHITKVEDLV